MEPLRCKVIYALLGYISALVSIMPFYNEKLYYAFVGEV
jgi:hypothetical protein